MSGILFFIFASCHPLIQLYKYVFLYIYFHNNFLISDISHIKGDKNQQNEKKM